MLRNGLTLKDDRGNDYTITTIGMASYKNAEDFNKYAELVLTGNSSKIGVSLEIVK